MNKLVLWDSGQNVALMVGQANTTGIHCWALHKRRSGGKPQGLWTDVIDLRSGYYWLGGPYSFVTTCNILLFALPLISMKGRTLTQHAVLSFCQKQFINLLLIRRLIKLCKMLFTEWWYQNIVIMYVVYIPVSLNKCNQQAINTDGIAFS